MPPTKDPHPGEEDIEDYALGVASDAQTAHIEEHLLTCETCCNHVREMDAYVSSMRIAAEKLRQAAPLRNSLFRTATLVGIAATVLLLAAIWAGRWDLGAPQMAPIAVSLHATRGAEPGAKAPAYTTLALYPDLAGLPVAPSSSLEVVDRQGNSIWRGRIQSAKIPPLSPGVYFVRAYSLSGALLREYGLTIEASH